ncbi:MAG: hypothetical protein M0P69_21185 [Bacteroidales bacterium]|jgi:hypothetical protein|nr:hypothetical protein [Bacteroidales bacterium]MDD3399056.1 hypothetical protein [Candidatus Methanomethylophilaceae archaeon]
MPEQTDNKLLEGGNWWKGTLKENLQYIPNTLENKKSRTLFEEQMWYGPGTRIDWPW